MDYPLGAYLIQRGMTPDSGLNPYSNGLPSRGTKGDADCRIKAQVLIPILMDYPLGVSKNLWIRPAL